MINLNDYINKSVAVQIDEELYHVKMPSSANMAKIFKLEKGLGTDFETDYEIKQETAYLLLNDNLEGKEIPKDIINKIPYNGILLLVTEVFKQRVELENDPNLESQSQTEK